MTLKPIDEILVSNSLNEVLNGLSDSPALLKLLKKKREIVLLDGEWKRQPTGSTIKHYSALVKEVVELVMQELGAEDFSTRTGVEISEAEEFLDRLGY